LSDDDWQEAGVKRYGRSFLYIVLGRSGGLGALWLVWPDGVVIVRSELQDLKVPHNNGRIQHQRQHCRSTHARCH